ncbi:MAG: hypothetical protein NNA22_03550 [Nitrospira sp.]|nr:hypothetical protein [Nitrospira sp.]
MTGKTPLTAGELLNDRVLPFFDHHKIPLNRVLTDRGTEDCGAPERHEHDLYLGGENSDHTRTKTRHLRTNGTYEPFHKTMLNELSRATCRKKIYWTLEELRTDLDACTNVCVGELQQSTVPSKPLELRQTPMQMFMPSVALAKEKILAD